MNIATYESGKSRHSDGGASRRRKTASDMVSPSDPAVVDPLPPKAIRITSLLALDAHAPDSRTKLESFDHVDLK
ncbi:hypothetical protein Vi05172_g11582 [Venturia inaequalis]|nr:hypothetical protein Vi05172_g11582 [Venturia inaequalis]